MQKNTKSVSTAGEKKKEKTESHATCFLKIRFQKLEQNFKAESNIPVVCHVKL